MPQPLRKKYGLLQLLRGPPALLSRPSLAVGIACVATAWGSVERGMEMLLLTMLGIDARIGHAMYRALTGSAAQRAAFDAVAKYKLTPEEQVDLTDIWQEFKVCGGMRNDIVHGVWASYSDFGDALILLDMDAQLTALASWEALDAKGDDDANAALSAGRHMLYKARDFDEAQARMNKLVQSMLVLGIAVRLRNPIKQADGQSGDP